MSDNKKLEEDIKKLVIERIRASSDSLELIVGGNEKLTKEQLIASVSENDETGKEIVRAQMEFLKAMASGGLFEIPL